MKPLRVHSRAKAEAREAAVYYEQRERGLGDDFKGELRDALVRIQENPLAGSEAHSDFRFQLVNRFPYVIYYKDYDRFVWIVAIAHGSRRPGYWHRRRLEE